MLKSATVTGLNHGLKPGDIVVLQPANSQGWKRFLPWSKEKWKVECIHGGTVGCTKLWNSWAAIKALLNPKAWEFEDYSKKFWLGNVHPLIHKDSGVVYNADMKVSFRNRVTGKTEYEFPILVYLVAYFTSGWLAEKVRQRWLDESIANWRIPSPHGKSMH